ncbi:MAG TPA: hypothetical protein PLZ08_01250 [Bacillota bacterium]|jgi:hypothetical protein|nr:hypothetical protein [Bacillota bacterium]HOL08875.1 hypothetical protein [Bacillota bacterium]HPO96568.1 hypothetical protein [Bacillota bacterium]
MQSPKQYEVETRFFFNSVEEAFAALPFLESSLTAHSKWQTYHYGLSLYHQDQVLRVGELVKNNNPTQFFLGWKGVDTGSFANIRAEIDEEITNGITNSAILAMLGGKSTHQSKDDVINELIHLNHSEFMQFSGENRLGFYEPLQLSLKLMSCDSLQYPLLVEIEKSTSDYKLVRSLEAELQAITAKYSLTHRVVHDEPPTLLYKALFGTNP